MDVSDLTQAEILATLYNATAPQGMGFLQATKEPMTIEQAQEIIDKYTADMAEIAQRYGREYDPATEKLHFDYVAGRPMKLLLDASGELNVSLYERDAGPGVAQMALDSYRVTRDANNAAVSTVHAQRLNASIARLGTLETNPDGYTKSEAPGGIPVFTLQATPTEQARLLDAAAELTKD